MKPITELRADREAEKLEPCGCCGVINPDMKFKVFNYSSQQNKNKSGVFDGIKDIWGAYRTEVIILIVGYVLIRWVI